MNLRRALNFGLQMALGYGRGIYTIARSFAPHITITLLSITLITLLWQGYPDIRVRWQELQSIYTLVFFVTVWLSVATLASLVWNVIGVSLAMIFMSQNLNLKLLRTQFPYYLFFFNLIGIPAIVTFLSWKLRVQGFSMLFMGSVIFLFGFFSASFSIRIWRSVIDEYEFGQFKKKRIPSTAKRHTPDANMDDVSFYLIDEIPDEQSVQLKG